MQIMCKKKKQFKKSSAYITSHSCNKAIEEEVEITCGCKFLLLLM